LGTIVDINCDMGELDSLEADGTQERLLKFVTSVNISCGAHAGDEGLVERTIRSAMVHGVRVGAHPGYPDRKNFGRIEMDMSPGDLAPEMTRQLRWFQTIADRCGCEVMHVKPHGALYNVAARKPEVAEAVASGVKAWMAGSLVMGLAGSPMLEVFERHGLRTWREGFADRAYDPDGTLRSRNLAGALIEDPDKAAVQAVELVRAGRVETICIHSDTPGSVAIAEAVASALR